MANLRSQTLWSSMPILITSVLSIVSVPIYFKVLGEEMYAMWFYVGTLTGAFGFIDLGLGVAVGRFIGIAMGAGDQQAVKEYWSTGNVIVLPLIGVFATAFILAGFAWAPNWFRVAEKDVSTLRWAMFFGGLGLFFNYYGQMWNILAQANLDFRYLSIVRTLFSLGSAIASLLIALIYPNVATIVAMTSLLAVGQFALLYFRGNRTYNLPVRFSLFRLDRLREMLPFTLKTFGQLLSGSIIGSLDRIYLGRVAPALDFAAFNVSLNIGSRLNGLSVAVMGPVFHNTVRGIGMDKGSNAASVYRDSFNFMFPWYSLISITAFFWAKPVTDLWLGERYGSAVEYCFPWVIGAMCIQAMANISGAQLGGLDRVGTSLILQTLSSIISLLGVLAGWSLAGISGAAIGFFFSRFVFIIQDIIVRRCIGIKFVEYYKPTLVMLRQCLISGIMWCIVHWRDSSSWTLLCAGAASALFGVAFEARLAFNARAKL